jgi:hypothetical protein
MERCPICRASLNGAETCRRCRAELGSVLRTDREARQLLATAMHRLVSGDPDAADRLLARSLLLHRTPEALALRKLAGRSRRGLRPMGTATSPMPETR